MSSMITGAAVYDPTRRDQVQAFMPGPHDYFALPAGITKAAAIASIAAALRLMGASEREIAVWRHIADTTDRAAWSASDRPPLNWRRQCDMAREMGLGERHWRNIERALVRYGVLARTTADNGYRGYRNGSSFARPLRAGLSLEPALANYPALVMRLAEADVTEAQRQEYILHARTARHRLSLLVAGLADRELRHSAQQALAALEAELRPAVLRSAEAPTLEAWHTGLLDLEDWLRDAAQPLAHEPSRHSAELPPELQSDILPKQNAGMSQEITGAPELGFRCHIQPESKLEESCNTSSQVRKRTPANAGDDNFAGLRPDGRNNCWGKKNARLRRCVNPDLWEKLTPDKIKQLASDDAALYLDGLDDWNEAIPCILRELGINISAWLDAVEVMGQGIAFVALIVIDRNRFHPVVPVRSPGGALRAFTRKAQAGELNLTRAIIGIWERERQGIQPKAHPKREHPGGVRIQ